MKLLGLGKAGSSCASVMTPSPAAIAPKAPPFRRCAGWRGDGISEVEGRWRRRHSPARAYRHPLCAGSTLGERQGARSEGVCEAAAAHDLPPCQAHFGLFYRCAAMKSDA